MFNRIMNAMMKSMEISSYQRVLRECDYVLTENQKETIRKRLSQLKN